MKWRRAFSVLLAFAFLAAGAGWYSLTRPFAGFSGEQFVTLEKGATSRSIARELAAAGVVASQWHFLGARAVRPRAVLQAGEYRFARPHSPLEVLGRLVRGDVYLVELSIPEGFNLFEIAEAVERAGLVPAAEFLTAAKDPEPIRDLAPRAHTLEGYLFPDTYRVPRRISAAELCRVLTRRFRAVWNKVSAGSNNVHGVVTLASMVEKETGRSGDRAVVASVYVNRLRRGMKLDCDPTTIYAALLEGRYRGAIHRSDLERDHPYNTYRRPGLPPGPIASPGEASLLAALRPAQTGYLYFVAQPDGSGRHAFSKDLRAHQSAVTRYRAGNAKTNRKKETPRRLDRRKKARGR